MNSTPQQPADDGLAACSGGGRRGGMPVEQAADQARPGHQCLVIIEGAAPRAGRRRVARPGQRRVRRRFDPTAVRVARGSDRAAPDRSRVLPGSNPAGGLIEAEPALADWGLPQPAMTALIRSPLLGASPRSRAPARRSADRAGLRGPRPGAGPAGRAAGQRGGLPAAGHVDRRRAGDGKSRWPRVPGPAPEVRRWPPARMRPSPAGLRADRQLARQADPAGCRRRPAAQARRRSAAVALSCWT